jgi:hypothetical protein
MFAAQCFLRNVKQIQHFVHDKEEQLVLLFPSKQGIG